jgi:hypothetical protein
MKKTYSIFGAGAAGLYTAWRLLSGQTKSEKGKAKQLVAGDVLELYDWGKYDFLGQEKGTRPAGARVCTWHYQNKSTNSYLELGGMRYSDWDGTPNGQGHRLVTTVIKDLNLDQFSVQFNESDLPLYFLRSKHVYLNQITATNPAPYKVVNDGQYYSPNNGFSIVGDLAVTPAYPVTRNDWYNFYRDGVIRVDMPASSVFKKGDKVKNIGYWNLMFDQLGSEGFNYTADGNGYTSNVINWNSGVAMQTNNEFTPGNQYKTLTHGYSSMFNALFDAIVKLAKEKGVHFEYHPNTRLHSILNIDGKVHYTIATRENPNKKSASKITDAAWMAMPRGAIDLVAQATRYEDHAGVDVLNHNKVALYLESAVLQPSYKVGMFFSEAWWLDKAKYPAPIRLYTVTTSVITALEGTAMAPYLYQMSQDITVMNQPFYTAQLMFNAVQNSVGAQLTPAQQQALTTAAVLPNTIGPSVTDMPIRQVVYFGNNALDKAGEPVYGILASYDDEQYTSFWEELEYGTDSEEKTPFSGNYQPLDGPRKAKPVMVNMLRQQLAALHFGPGADYHTVPEPLETRYMDWSLPPFNAGYHAYAAHYDVCDVQRKIRKPSQLIPGTDANIFIVGEAYSNDQAWVEGAYCTAESVLNDFFDIKPIINNVDYPFIAPPLPGEE